MTTTITLPRATVEQALEALTPWMDSDHTVQHAAYHALRTALAQEQAEPVQEHEDWCASVTQLLLSYPPQKAPCNCKKKQAEPAQEPEPGEYHGWVLREVLFDNGEPVGHREPVQEPVAFIHRQGNHWEVSERHLDEDEKDRGWTEEPLYTAPPKAEPNAEYERGFIDGMQKQAQSSVDRAVNRMAEPERHFCERCGKRLSQDGVHTCTPPQQIEQAMLDVWQDVPGAVNFGIKE